MTAQNQPSTESLSFNLVREEIPVTLNRPGDPAPWECVLREMDGFNRDVFLNSQKQQISVSTREIKDFKNLQARLIAMCLFDKTTDQLVPIKDISEFPAKVQSKIYEACIKLNALNEQSEQEVKND